MCWNLSDFDSNPSGIIFGTFILDFLLYFYFSQFIFIFIDYLVERRLFLLKNNIMPIYINIIMLIHTTNILYHHYANLMKLNRPIKIELFHISMSNYV